MKISAILLAAGLSSRMGKDKLRMEYKGKTLINYALNLLESLPASERIVVTKKENPNSDKGISTSIRAGVERATGTHYLFLAADQPCLTADDIMPLIELSRENPDKIIYPIVNNNPCSPAIFPKSFKTELLALTGDTGGRKIRDAHPDMCITHNPKHPENFKDIDSEADL